MDSDPELEIIEKDKDSGMSSLGNSKGETPERRGDGSSEDIDCNCVVAKSGKVQDDKLDEYADEPDESAAERLYGLTEMFPDCIQNLFGKIASVSVSGTVNLYKFTCNASWIVFTTSMLLFAPILFETERAQMEEMERSQQKQVLLGPGSALSQPGGMPTMPPMNTR